MPNCKYIKQQEIVSYNGGVDWQDVMPAQYRKGQLIEHDSEDCGELDTIYRWRKLTGVYLCVDDVKYEKLILDESYDGGLSWYPAYPSQYTTGEAVGVDEDYCNDKFIGHYELEITSSTGGTIGHSCSAGYYWNGYRCVIRRTGHGPTGEDPIKIVKCDGNPELTSADTKYYTSYPSNYKFSLLSAEIGKCVTSIAASAFTNSSSMTYVNVADSVTSIGNYAFYRCTSLSGMNTTIPGELNIQSGVTSIGSSAFQGCSGLTSITIPNSVTSIGSYAFNGCSNLTSITIPNSVTSIGGSAFKYCSSLTSCTIGSGVTSIGTGAFTYCSSLTNITINAATPPTLLTTVIDQFDYTNNCPIYVPCESLTAYTMNNKWSKYADRIQGIAPCETPFKWKATYSDSHTESGNCGSSTVITENEITKAGLASVEIGQCTTSIGGYAFSSCSGLTSIDIPDSVTSIDQSAFNNCGGLTSIAIPNSVTSIGNYAFNGCSGLTSIIIPDSVTSMGGNAFAYCSGATSCTVGNGVTSIGAGTFRYCSNITSCTIGSGVTSIGEYAFSYCTRLTSFTIYAATPPTLDIRTFYNASSTFKIYVPSQSVNAYKTANIWNQYADRIQPIPPVTTAKWLATYSNSSVTSAECDSTSEIVQNEINLTNLVSVEISDCVTSIGVIAFGYCYSLTSVTIPSSVTSIGDWAFAGCSGLTSIDIPSSVVSISGYAFYDCSGLTSITIPDSVTSIGENAFIYCSSLTSATVEATTPPTLGASAFDLTNDCPIYVPAASLEAYKAASVWRKYASRIQAIT